MFNENKTENMSSPISHHNCPPNIRYIPNFITEDQESILLKEVESVPLPKWVFLSNRRLQNWGGVPTVKGMVTEPLPTWLEGLSEKLKKVAQYENINPEIWGQQVSTNVFKPNHCLVNEYEAGQGIMPHLDGPVYGNKNHDTVIIFSLAFNRFVINNKLINDIFLFSSMRNDCLIKFTLYP